MAVDDLTISGIPLAVTPASNPPGIRGASVPAIIIDGSGNDRALDHSGAGRLDLFGMQLRNGVAQGAGGCVRSSGNVALVYATVSGCTADELNFGDGVGGGVSTDGDSPEGPSDVATQCGIGSCDLSIDGANNLFTSAAATLMIPTGKLSDDPLLVALADNGGPTQTHALDPASPAIDRGNDVGAGLGIVIYDQRHYGYSRIGGASADIGAFEHGAGPDRIFKDGFDGES